MSDTLPGLGHNNPPNDADLLIKQLNESYQDWQKRVDDMVAGVERMGDVTADNCEQAVAFAKQFKLVSDDVENLKKNEKSQYDVAGKVVGNFFGAMTEKMEAARQTVLERLTSYMKASSRDTIKNQYGNSAGLREDLEVSITNSGSVPPEYWAPDLALVKKKVKDLHKEGKSVEEIAKAIPGISVVLIRKAVVS